MNIFEIFQEDFLYHEYQPLHYLREGQPIFAYEALLRNLSKVNPEQVFQTATRANILYKLDSVSIHKAVQTFANRIGHGQEHLFLNIYITTILHPNFHKFFEHLVESFPSIVQHLYLEVNESSAEEMWQNNLLKESMNNLREYGVKFAIDDFGQGSSSLKKAIEYQPECIKLDRFFASNLSKDERKQRFLSFFHSYFGKDTFIVLEGIETFEDLKVAEQLGIHAGQGYYLGKPAELAIGS
ncbi:hypothetical protein Q73_00785 [Bacillus coahuilensis m2-6]|uniref:EAL domain-containing protein n=1 Tax=Bacillus coahuilensis TaxID=408580 RepID=UPI000750161F|nr:EAL domain-containing protein [Bacillus coahuilensis]KUP09812.1 hypothetical protein Q73_00785 [Bacillus coahuilensis m2-6]